MAAAALGALRREAAAGTRCAIYRSATQTVLGEGPADADFVFVGEAPGNQEDVAGKPFVGPAGKVLDRALKDAGLITVHPSYLLRIPDERAKDAEYKKFVADLKLAKKLAAR